MVESVTTTRGAGKMDIRELLSRLSTNEKGLSSPEAKERLRRYGYNEISEKKKSALLKLLGYFWGPIPGMIEIAAVLSALVHHWEDFWIIFALLLLIEVAQYRSGRITSFLHPTLANDWQLIQGKYAIGSGGWFGVGLGDSQQKWGWLPNADTDFIFAILGEELGLVGTGCVVLLYGGLAFAGARVPAAVAHHARPGELDHHLGVVVAVAVRRLGQLEGATGRNVMKQDQARQLAADRLGDQRGGLGGAVFEVLLGDLVDR